MPPSAFRLDMAQILVEGGKPAANLDRAVSAIRRAGELGCRVVVLPECLDIGWTHPSTRDFAQPIPGPHFARLAQAAKDAGVYVAAGLVERAGPKIFNAAVLIGPNGELLLHHRKINELDIALD
ncbi:MAG TPA: carbon-nitrogen hydrolase family protein, partial [Gemmataceae bacterium]|nr:carbon-nitrogen hydrolase family protein [Gemmataceae bacterium]